MVFMTVSNSYAKSADHDQADAQALDLAKQAIALRSVRGPGNRVPQVAALGLNERIPVGDVRPSMDYMLSLFTDLSK
jgi:hypothetical protein